MEIRIERYNTNIKKEWDNFIANSKNGTFLFCRDFMEYHSDRFSDFSLLFYHKNKLIALLPANVSGTTIYSHQGLTYGGLILSESVTAKLVLCIFDCLQIYFKQNEISELVYKTIPYIYHKLPSDEDLYALFRNNAQLVGRAVSTCISKEHRIKYSELRKRGIRKAQYESLMITEAIDFSTFWKILAENLSQKYKTSPVHTLEEIELLKNKFPENIRLFEVSSNKCILGGCIIFETDKVAHVQYISASDDGKKHGALDFLFDHLIQRVYADKIFLEFGTSTEKNGWTLNEGLIAQKEGFGGRAIVYDTYKISV